MVCAVFGFGITELIVVGLVILMLFSPRELPGMMKTLARVYGSIRRTAEEFRAQVMEAEELREPIEDEPAKPAVPEASKPASPPVPEASKPATTASTSTSAGLVVPPAPRYPSPVSDRSDAA